MIHVTNDIVGNIRMAGRLAVVCICAALAVLLATGCAPADDGVKRIPLVLDIDRPDQQRVLEFQDRQMTDSLLALFHRTDPALRYRAALAFASIGDTTVVHALGGLLDDQEPMVRMAAAYALGQTGARQAEDILINAFEQYDSTGRFIHFNAHVLEAVGKTGGVRSLRFLSTIRSYGLADSVLILGQARGIYRFALRGIVLPEGTATMVDRLESTELPSSVRVVAANYLLRARDIQTGEHLPVLIPIFGNDPDPRIRMCLAAGIAKGGDPQSIRVLQRRFSRESDYRVQCNIIRALTHYPYADGAELAFRAVEYKNLHVAQVGAQYLVDHGVRQDALRYRGSSKARLPWEVKTLLYKASNKYLGAGYRITRENINSELTEWLRRATNPYERAAVIDALAADFSNYRLIFQRGFTDDHPAVRSASVQAIADISKPRLEEETDAGTARAVRAECTTFLVDAIRSEDPAMIAVAAEALSRPEMREGAREHLDAMRQALDKLQLPREAETHNALAECIATLEGKQFEKYTPGYNHPIEWESIRTLNDTVRAEVITAKGTFVATLFPALAPGTVANFVRLSRDQFYNGKNFHRVVPNFVVQGGCPRGDGYGSLDYSIRSELPPLYYDSAGYLGMASAGNHTEGTQWFVTHAPTPHLDGRYTIFGKVIRGMEIVHDIHVGDEIREINILN